MGGETLYDSVREALATGILLIEICNILLFAIVSMTHSLSMMHSLVFPFLVLTVVNLLFYISFYWTCPASCSVFVKVAHRSVVGPRCSMP